MASRSRRRFSCLRSVLGFGGTLLGLSTLLYLHEQTGTNIFPIEPKGSAVARPRVTSARAAGASNSHAQARLGIPTDRDPSDDILLDRGAYLASYNPSMRVANWVSWQLRSSDVGELSRKDQFHSDSLLPMEYYKVTSSDYSGSGFDRGHLCPSKDRSVSGTQNAATFLMTNIQPQRHSLNAGPWEKLESYARTLVRRSDVELSIVAGGIFAREPPRIGHNVAVPAGNYKIIVAMAAGVSADQLSGDSLVLAVLMPNLSGLEDRDWTDYLTTVSEIERVSGYDFLSALPDIVERRIESREGRPF